MIFSEITKERWNTFRHIKRAYYSLWILVGAYLISLLSPVICNDNPYILKYQGTYYFPLFKTYTEKEFGGQYATEPDYLQLNKKWEQNKKQNSENKDWMWFPPIPHNPLYTYLEEEGSPPHAPSWKHWLGTDTTARDVLARLLYGFRICMTFALLFMLVTAFLGILIGGIQGYLGGKVDLFLRNVIEVWAALPFLYVVILLGSFWGRSFGLLLFILGAFSWISLSYYIRVEFLSLKQRAFIHSAKVLGYSNVRIFWKHILPNAMTPVVTLLPFILIGGIGSLTALDFLGFGLQPPTPSWGEMLSQGLQALYAPWITFSAVGALFITLLLATFVGEGVREAFDPKSNLVSGQKSTSLIAAAQSQQEKELDKNKVDQLKVKKDPGQGGSHG
jgi:microcin C transport system permease protein